MTELNLQDAFQFRDYYDIANELHDPWMPNDMSDFTPTARKQAKRFAEQHGLAYPPRLADAEDFYNRNRDAINAHLI